MSILGWWIGACSGLSLVSRSVLGLAQFLHPDLEVEQWHEYCVYLATLIITSEIPWIAIFGFTILADYDMIVSVASYYMSSENTTDRIMVALSYPIWIYHLADGPFFYA